MTTAPTQTDESSLESRAPTVAGLFALVIGVSHLFYPGLGLGTFVSRLAIDPGLFAADPRPALFVVSGFGIVLGVALGRNARNRAPYYLVGIGISLSYILGYVGWHLSGHGGFLPGREPLYHGLSPVENVVAHLTGEPIAALLLVLEVLLVALLVYSYE